MCVTYIFVVFYIKNNNNVKYNYGEGIVDGEVVAPVGNFEGADELVDGDERRVILKMDVKGCLVVGRDVVVDTVGKLATALRGDRAIRLGQDLAVGRDDNDSLGLGGGVRGGEVQQPCPLDKL